MCVIVCSCCFCKTQRGWLEDVHVGNERGTQWICDRYDMTKHMATYLVVTFPLMSNSYQTRGFQMVSKHCFVLRNVRSAVAQTILNNDVSILTMWHAFQIFRMQTLNPSGCNACWSQTVGFLAAHLEPVFFFKFHNLPRFTNSVISCFQHFLVFHVSQCSGQIKLKHARQNSSKYVTTILHQGVTLHSRNADSQSWSYVYRRNVRRPKIGQYVGSNYSIPGQSI